MVFFSSEDQFRIQKTNSEFSRRIFNSAGESSIQQTKSAFSGTRCARARASRAANKSLMTPTMKFTIRPFRRATIRLIVFTASSCRLIDLRSGSVLTVRVTVTVTVTLVVSRSIKDFGVSTGAQASTVTLENFSQF
jgi:hypothetical protein